MTLHRITGDACIASFPAWKCLRAISILALLLGCSSTAADEYRFWTTANNQRSQVRLTLVEQTESTVRLKREDNGKVVELRIDQLSLADRQFLRSRSGNSAQTEENSDGARQGERPQQSADNWPRFRGPDGLGVSSDVGLPLEWNADKNVVWKTELPGPGASSPITWGDHIYLTCYTGYGLSQTAPGRKEDIQRRLVCINRDDGKVLWQQSVPGQFVMDYVAFLALHGYASSTPVADESGVFVFFGNCGVAHYSHAGEKRWARDFADGVHSYGSASSPILFDDLLIVHADIEEKALIALKKETGDEVWRVDTGSGDSWSTPLLLKTEAGHEVVFHHSKGEPKGKMAAVDARKGTPRWECQVLRDYLCPSPIARNGVIYAIAYGKGAAVRAAGSGDVTESHVVWENGHGSEVVTPVYHDGHLYFAHQENGIAYCIDCKTGEAVYQERLQPTPGPMYASGVLADGRLYYVSREKGTYVVAAKPQFQLLAHNKIDTDDSIFNGTPAISRAQLLIRSNKYLYCIGEK